MYVHIWVTDYTMLGLFHAEGLISKKSMNTYLVNTRFQVVLMFDILWRNWVLQNYRCNQLID